MLSIKEVIEQGYDQQYDEQRNDLRQIAKNQIFFIMYLFC